MYLLHGRVESTLKEPLQNSAENPLQRFIAEWNKIKQVKVPDVALGNTCSPSTRWAHRSHELHVDELAEGVLLAVVPASVVHPLTQNFDRWLCAVRLLGGHVKVVYEDDACHPQRRAEHTLAALVKLRIDNVLRLCGETTRRGGNRAKSGSYRAQLVEASWKTYSVTLIYV